MKLSGAKIEAFVKSPDAAVFAVLIYGPDSGLVSQRAEKLSKHVVEDLHDPFRVVDISMERLKDDPALLSDEMAAISFGGGKRLIRIRAEGGAGLAPAFKAAFTTATKHTAQDVCVVVTAGDLAATSALRQLFEQGDGIVALPCYVDDARSLTPVIREAIAQHGLRTEQGVVEYLATFCQGDRLMVLKEIEKLALYAGESKQVSLSDAAACVGESTESSLEDISNAVLLGQLAPLTQHYEKALHQGIVPIAIIRTLARGLARIAMLMELMEQGQSAESAVQSLRPPVFFKQVSLVTAQARRWEMLGLDKLRRAQEKMIEVEIACKTTGNPAELLCHRALFEIAAQQPTRRAA